MTHDLVTRTYRMSGQHPTLGEDEVFGKHQRDGRPWAYAAIKHGGEFHVYPVQSYDSEAHEADRGRYEYIAENAVYGIVYGPIHPGMTIEDIEGATYAHDNGTSWQFAHCSPQEQIDFAADAELYTRQQLGLDIAEANAALSVATETAARSAAKAKVDALVEFAKAAGRRAHALVVGQTLGYYHREPHNDHLRDIAYACINAQQLDWIARASRDQDSIRIQAAVRAIKLRLESTHDIEWRAAREKRLNDAAAARGDDPVAGYEYCYVLSQTAAEITGDANLPDPAWPFDRLRTGTIGRGLFVYSDAEPKTNTLLAWVVRFKRRIPEGTQPGANIGSVAWEQEAAYQPSS